MTSSALSTRQQIYQLRRAATEVLAHWPIEVARLRLLNHDYNTTFRVETPAGDRFALRLNVNSRRTPGNLNAEAAWLAALATETDLKVPVPQPTRAGRLRAEVYVGSLGRTLPAVLMSWLPGPELGFRASATRTRHVGRLTAHLHRHAETWMMPSDADLPLFEDPLFNDPDRLTGNPDIDAISADASEVVAEALTRTRIGFSQMGRAATPRPLHADLHGANLKWHQGELAVFDFDDSGLATPLLDLAISAYYLRPNEPTEVALLEGYAEVEQLPDYSREQFEALVASRNLLMMNDIVASSTAAIREMTPRYLRNSIRKLRQYLDTEVYTHDVAGLEH